MTMLTKEQIEALLNRIAEIKADLDEFDGDTRGHKAALWNAQEELEDAAPDLASTALDALVQLADAKVAQALVVERAAALTEAASDLAESMRAIRDNTPSPGAKVVATAALRQWDAALATVTPPAKPEKKE